jgi:hypothetical protein
MGILTYFDAECFEFDLGFLVNHYVLRKPLTPARRLAARAGRLTSQHTRAISFWKAA